MARFMCDMKFELIPVVSGITSSSTCNCTSSLMQGVTENVVTLSNCLVKMWHKQ